MTFRKYVSTDVSAPSLTGEIGSFNAFIKQILVGTSGVAYGSKASAGWSVAFESGTTLVLRNSLSGSGSFTRFDDSVARITTVQTYEGMTDVNTGTWQASESPVYLLKQSTDATLTSPVYWVVVADDKTCYVNVYGYTALTNLQTTYYNPISILGFGDFETFVTGDSGVFLAGRPANNNITWSYSSTWTGSHSGICVNSGNQNLSNAVTYYGIGLTRDWTLTTQQRAVVQVDYVNNSSIVASSGWSSTQTNQQAVYKDCLMRAQGGFRGRLRNFQYAFKDMGNTSHPFAYTENNRVMMMGVGTVNGNGHPTNRSYFLVKYDE